ncbi:MAG: glycosyltransferase domain-containing protein [Bacteroidota bacterium]
MSAQIVTISSYHPPEFYYAYDYLFQTAGDNEILVLGQENGEFTGLSDKPRILYNAIKDGKIKEKIICFIDAWDVILASSLEEIIEKYKSFNCPIVIGAEKNCFPANFKKEYDKLPSTSSFKYLNSGVIIGETDAIMEVLEVMDAPNLPRDYYNPQTGTNYHFNDQAYYMDLFLRQPVTMKLDYNCEIAQNMQGVTMDDISLSVRLDKEWNQIRPEIRNNETKFFPLILHWNGSSKSDGTREPILKHLNLI